MQSISSVTSNPFAWMSGMNHCLVKLSKKDTSRETSNKVSDGSTRHGCLTASCLQFLHTVDTMHVTQGGSSCDCGTHYASRSQARAYNLHDCVFGTYRTNSYRSAMGNVEYFVALGCAAWYSRGGWKMTVLSCSWSPGSYH